MGLFVTVSLPVVVAAMPLTGVGLVLVNVAGITLTQRRSPHRLIGRVFAAIGRRAIFSPGSCDNRRGAVRLVRVRRPQLLRRGRDLLPRAGVDEDRIAKIQSRPRDVAELERRIRLGEAELPDSHQSADSIGIGDACEAEVRLRLRPPPRAREGATRLDPPPERGDHASPAGSRDTTPYLGFISLISVSFLFIAFFCGLPSFRLFHSS